LKSVSKIPYIAGDADLGRQPGAMAPAAANRAVHEDFAMTIEIIYLTAQIQRWLNRQVARHLAAQAERLAR
jgi:hypothetical protein